jgi:hypothetical protein
MGHKSNSKSPENATKEHLNGVQVVGGSNPPAPTLISVVNHVFFGFWQQNGDVCPKFLQVLTRLIVILSTPLLQHAVKYSRYHCGANNSRHIGAHGMH